MAGSVFSSSSSRGFDGSGGSSGKHHHLHRGRRCRARATPQGPCDESTGEIGERIALARAQLEQAHRFRTVRNDDLGRATSALAAGGVRGCLVAQDRIR
jgi:hypothetical protein